MERIHAELWENVGNWIKKSLTNKNEDAPHFAPFFYSLCVQIIIPTIDIEYGWVLDTFGGRNVVPWPLTYLVNRRLFVNWYLVSFFHWKKAKKSLVSFVQTTVHCLSVLPIMSCHVVATINSKRAVVQRHHLQCHRVVMCAFLRWCECERRPSSCCFQPNRHFPLVLKSRGFLQASGLNKFWFNALFVDLGIWINCSLIASAGRPLVSGFYRIWQQWWLFSHEELVLSNGTLNHISE